MKHIRTIRKWLSYGLVSSCLFTTSLRAQAQGAARAMDFPGTTAFEHINLGDSLSNKLDTLSFTLEMWINVDNSTNGDPAFIGNKDWNVGTNTGFAWALYNSTTLRFNFRPANGTRRDYNTAINKLQGGWNHIAMVVNRKGSLTAYVNGVQSGTPINISADSARTLDGILPVRLGSDGTGAYNYNGVSRFDGKLDEVRIWTGSRTEQQIKENMCHKLAGTEANLLAYYPMNEASGTTVNNNATSFSSVFNGTLLNSPVRINSAAPVGDTSISLYPATWAAQTLTLGSAANGTITTSAVSGGVKAMHLYRINVAPNNYTGIPNPNANSTYFGVFPVDTATANGSFTTVYNYTNFPNANTFEQGTDLYKRFSSDSTWAGGTSVKNTTANTFTDTAVNGRKELIIGNFTNPYVCNAPTAVTLNGVSYNGASYSWTSGGSGNWNVQYGTNGFTLGSGTKVNYLTAANYTITGLAPNTAYQFYVQDTCPVIPGSSAWAGPYSFTTLPDYSKYGSGYAINFPGTSANEHVNLGTTMSAELDTADFTAEMWVNFTSITADETFFANKNWNNGANIGFALGRSNKSGFPTNTLWFNMTPVNGARRDWHITIPGLKLIKNWNHVAITVKRNGNIAFYINGIPANIVAYALNGSNSFTTVSMDISADSGRSMKGTLPVRLGQDGTGTYGVKFNGRLDEVRIWKTVRTQTQIRDYMCRKLAVNTTGLTAYYRMDEPSGNVAANLATATAGSFNGALTNAPQHVVSGAPIGDTSVYVYNTNISTSTLQLSSAAYGNVKADSLIPSYAGLQLYRVDTIPNTNTGIANIGTTKAYFGVFPIDTADLTNSSTIIIPDAHYRISYNYANYPNAVTNNANVHLYNRNANDATVWTNTGAVNQAANNQLTIALQQYRKELILADFAAASCTAVSNLTADTLTNNHAHIVWTSAASNWNVQYGVHGFTLGQGTTDTTATAAKALNGLTGDTYYDVYVRSRCGNDSSAWTGPLVIHTADACPAPANVTVQYLGGDSVKIAWNMNGTAVSGLQWGQQGFALGVGIPVDGLTNGSYVLTGLSNTQAYDVYVRDTCTANGYSKWYGPVTFQANGPVVNGVPSANGINNVFTIYPNPASTFIVLQQPTATTTTIQLLNVNGAVVRSAVINNTTNRIDLQELPAGMYLLRCRNANALQVFKITIQQ